jgi:hypothetical protein
MTSQVLIVPAKRRIVLSRKRQKQAQQAGPPSEERTWRRGNNPASGATQTQPTLPQIGSHKSEEDAMKSKPANTKALSLGPFSTLVLLTLSRRASTALEGLNPGGSLPDFQSGLELPKLAQSGSVVAQPPIALGPLLTLILTVAGDRSEEEPNQRHAADFNSAWSECSRPQSKVYWFRTQVHTL